ncbi:MAG: RNA polymerase recycling motor ATPase HelR [Aeromicrobium sp.]|uniref:RNA polymerase recycling motor ATPase HelR n=1 Tax=Aeromicrobium sp. TaxID=1871063 RepID=UPI0039E2CC4D
MNTSPRPVFALPARLHAKADPALIADDERHLQMVADRLAAAIAELSDHLATVRRAPAGPGQQALDRDQEVHRLTARLKTLRRHGLDLCLGTITSSAGSLHIGRLGLSDSGGEPLLVDWRAPAAEPFFAATHARPLGVATRRRYRWTDGQITDYWDEDFTGTNPSAALDDHSAFIASLGASRSPRMRDVLGTIQADQDAIVRASSRGPLVVDGGPGTGKTVVALHRAAYLLYADPLVDERRGGVLVVGPHRPYLSYVADVLPSLGEDGVRTCVVADLVPEGATTRPDDDPRSAALKADGRMVDAIEPAVALYEEPPTDTLRIDTAWGSARLTAADWAEAFATPDPGTPHNEARDQIWEALLTILLDQNDDEDAPRDRLRRALATDEGLLDVFGGAWPTLDAADLVGDLWSVPAYLRRCAPWLSDDEVRLLQREEPQAWTTADLPLLDAARHRLGDPEASRRRRRREAALAAQAEEMTEVIEHLVASDDSEMQVMSMLRRTDMRTTLVDENAAPQDTSDRLAGPFAHIVVDEAQELTDAQWRMVLRRCPSRSLTIVGDRAQARQGFPEPWEERLARVGLDHARLARLTVNYRTPEEVMAEAAPVIRGALPDANVPTSIRSTGVPVLHGHADDLATILDDWPALHDDGVACVIGDPSFASTDRVRSLSPVEAKGLEFDLVVLVDPDGLGEGVTGAVDRYVAMTRATGQLALLTR